MGLFLIFVTEQKPSFLPSCGTSPLPHSKMNKHSGVAALQPLVSLTLTRSHFCSFLNHNLLKNKQTNKTKHLEEYLWAPYFSNGLSSYQLSRVSKDGHKSPWKIQIPTAMSCLCPLVTRCNSVKVIKLNKYDFNNSKLIEKLAAFRVLFLKKKKKRYT